MHPLLPLSFSLLAAVAGTLASPSSTARSQNEDPWAECKAHLNGELPYYVPPNFQFSGTVRRYYVAAEVVTWDYAPTGLS